MGVYDRPQPFPRSYERKLAANPLWTLRELIVKRLYFFDFQI